MKVLQWFIGFFFIILIAISQSVEADNIIPPSLQSAIETVKKMKRSGASKKDIATFVTNTVSNRLTFLNHKFFQKDGSVFVKDEIEKKVKYFNTWREMQDDRSTSYTAYSAIAIWAWENRMGQCDEAASTAFHILAMAYESTKEIIPVNMPNHRFVIFGDTNIPNPFMKNDLHKLDNTYIIDPWDGKSFSTKDLSSTDVFQNGKGNPQGVGSYRAYLHRYNKWLNLVKENPVKYQKWLHGLSDTAAEDKVEDKDSMNFMLDQYRKEINQLNALKKQIVQSGNASLEKIRTEIRLIARIHSDAKIVEPLISAFVSQGKDICIKVEKLHQKILALSSAMEDGETLVNTRINLAKGRRKNCQSDADGVFITNNYHAAQDAYAIMVSAQKGAFETLVDIKINLEQIKKVNNELSQFDRKWWKNLVRENDEALEVVAHGIEQLKEVLKAVNEFPTKVQNLKKNIESAKQHYIQYFPASKGDFDQLMSEVSSIRLYSEVSDIALDDLEQMYQEIGQTPLHILRGKISRFQGGNLQVVRCLAIETSTKVMDKIDETFLRGQLEVNNSKYLLEGCKEKTVAQAPSGTPTDTPSPSTGGSTPGISVTDPATSSNVIGGLMIAGPAEVTVGDGVTYTATDRAGKIYTEGSFVWSVNDRGVVNLGESGNPVSGSAYKAGTFVLMLKHDGATVFLDVRIKEEENNLFGTTGGENSETGQGDLFGTFGGETTTDNASQVVTVNCDHIPGSTAVQGKCICTGDFILSPSVGRCISCAKYYQVSKSAIDDGELDAAQAILNEARACTSWTSEVQGLINSGRQDQLCNSIAGNLQAVCQANDVMAIHGFMTEANQNNCIIDGGLWEWGNTLITEHNQKVEDERIAQNSQQQSQASQPQQPQNQASWMDVFHTVVKGVEEVKKNRDKKPAKPSFPTSSDIFNQHGDRTWQGASGTIGGRNTSSEAGTWNSLSSGSNSQCGRKMSKAELAPRLAKFKNTVKTQWVPKGLVTWSSLFDTNIYLGRDLNRDRYEANVKIWNKRVNCYNSCVQAAPNKAPNRNLKPFYACIRNCGSNKFRYMSCP